MESKFPRNQEGVSLLSGAVCRLSRLGRAHTKGLLYWAAGPGRSSSEVHSVAHESHEKVKQRVEGGWGGVRDPEVLLSHQPATIVPPGCPWSISILTWDQGDS